MSSKRKKQGRNKKNKTENTNQFKEQHGEDELNDVGANVVTLDEEVIDPLLLHSLVRPGYLHIHQVLASNGRGAGMHVNPLEQVFSSLL